MLLVTHDPKVASYAHRTIRITDGLVEGDEINTAVVGASNPPAPHIAIGGNGDGGDEREPAMAVSGVSRFATGGAPGGTDAPTTAPTTAPATAVGCASNGPGGCTARKSSVGADVDAESTTPLPKHAPSVLPATWRTALNALRRNKMRSMLSALGVIIAVAAVIAMTEIGQGSKATLQKGLAGMGANTLMVLPGSASIGGVAQGSGSMMTLTPEDAEAIARLCPAVMKVAPNVSARSQIVYGNRNCVPERVNGTTPDYLVVRNWGEMAEGVMFTDADVRNSKKVCVIGKTIKDELFPNESSLGKQIRINNVPFRVIGVLGAKGANMMGRDQDNIVLAPWTTIKFRVSGSALMSTNQSASASSSSTSTSVNSISDLYPTATSLYLSRTSTQEANNPMLTRFVNVDVIQVKAKSAEEVKDAISQITTLLRDRHHLAESEEDDFAIHDMAEISKMLSTTSETMSTLLLVVALISLVVGGVGIMNIMLVSVTERTREIGLRMAVGARSHHILRQFLVEAVVLCLLGGTIGILFGRGASLLVRSFMRWPTEVSLPAIIAAVAVSVGVGVIFGFYPAWKASRLDPIEALRYE